MTLASDSEEMKRLKWQEAKREIFLVILGLVVALTTGLTTLYMGKPWGTWLDYLTAFLWGIATKTALDLLLVPALDQLAKVRPFGPTFHARA